MPMPPRNLLGEEGSPYLRQHAANPVHWRPWSAAALQEAQELDRPILLSIGYAACHWCHVMAHESFEDPATAAIMNRLFVNIKVDREERPDIDQIHMTALSVMGERGGWPLTMFLTPHGQPFWGGTYFPPEPRLGRPSFTQVLDTVDAAWKSRKDTVHLSALALVHRIEGQLSRSAEVAILKPETLKETAAQIHSLIDHEKGGVRGTPKFPNMPLMQTLWLSWLINGNSTHRDDVLFSLETMLAGGIFDHVGGGLCRYSTDADWYVPHFEKMLYDNAQLLRLCNWAFAETGNGIFRRRIEETVAWLLREMRAEGGAFASSLDADSDGEEGLYYTWGAEEVSAALTDGNWQEFFTLVKSAGWEGNPVLCQTSGQQAYEIEHVEEASRFKTKLFAVRQTRPRPARDDKILTDWNGLAIMALAECGRSLGRSDWIEAAAAAFACLAASADQGRLPHSAVGNKRLFPALSSDYAAMANAAVALFEATSDRNFIELAQDFIRQLDRWHAGTDRHDHFLTASDANDVLIRSRGDVDDAIPSATAQIVEAMLRVGMAAGDVELLQRALSVAERAAGRVARQANGGIGITNACALAIAPRKLMLVDTPTEPTLIAVANRCPDPRRIDIILSMGKPADWLRDGSLPSSDRPGAYLCLGPVCLPAITDPSKLEEKLRRVGAEPAAL